MTNLKCCGTNHPDARELALHLRIEHVGNPLVLDLAWASSVVTLAYVRTFGEMPPPTFDLLAASHELLAETRRGYIGRRFPMVFEREGA
jgi:hypothetical protein